MYNGRVPSHTLSCRRPRLIIAANTNAARSMLGAYSSTIKERVVLSIVGATAAAWAVFCKGDMTNRTRQAGRRIDTPTIAVIFVSALLPLPWPHPCFPMGQPIPLLEISPLI